MTFIPTLLSHQTDLNWPNQDGYFDTDLASFILGKSLGLWEPGTTYLDIKWVFWCANPVGDNLCRMLELMLDAGILEGDVGGTGCRVRIDRERFKRPILEGFEQAGVSK